MNTKNNRYLELDALRGIAAIMIVFFHFTLYRNEAELGFKLGTTGVDLFFMISGFVILLSLERIKKSKQFIINRVSRLYPTYWVSATFTFILIIIYSLYKNNPSDIEIIQYFANLTMFQFYLNIPDLDGPYWTLIIEMLFYIFMLVLFHFNKLKHIVNIGLSLNIIIAFIGHFGINQEMVQILFSQVPILQFWPLFYSGILFYILFTRPVSPLKLFVLIGFCLLLQISLYDYSGVHRNYISQIEYSIMLISYFTIFTLFIHGKLKFLIQKPLLFFGEISFALYLIHQFLSLKIVIPVLINRFGTPFWVAAMVAFSLSIIFATLITYYIEIPYRPKLKTKLNKITDRFSLK